MKKVWPKLTYIYGAGADGLAIYAKKIEEKYAGKGIHHIYAGDDFSRCVLMEQVEEGKIYELIITNLSGFYRYRMSDAVKVTGFINKTPLIQFMYRVNKTISVALEKTTEPDVEILQPETGILYREMMIYRGANPSQLKPVHVIMNERQKAFFFALIE